MDIIKCKASSQLKSQLGPGGLYLGEVFQQMPPHPWLHHRASPVLGTGQGGAPSGSCFTEPTRSLEITSVYSVLRLVNGFLHLSVWYGGDVALPSPCVSQLLKWTWMCMARNGRKSPFNLLLSSSQVLPETNLI